ncbi:ABC transporter ATP-binding protein [Pseudooceanicola atlanticus]|uniref:Peptide ABC transporter ATP-binding protein n=1 Tax=Pseudooceanicola atlanticus TaxID=1461694 RepID=A0A0A0EDK5_9RHOB|nr:oligopeptide/dipeptide ABC transporter ATP-binding protein [Pseudooceanicola atlanticus]KGM49061.1 peptide ABC transporter ATP-binding protein [Pseudooceanicola atlanticus]
MNAEPGKIDTFLAIDNLTVEYPLQGGRKVHAVTDFTAHVKRGETLGLVGESGCGKSSAARAVMQLPRPTRGKVTLDGQDLTGLKGRALQQARRRFQMIFQDPIASLNPRMNIRDIVAAPLEIAGIGTEEERTQRVAEMLEKVGLNADQAMERRPHEFSGGQCQRISIARALILEPDLLVCDEAVSALDVSVQAQVLNLLEELKKELGLTMLFISHDLAVVKHVSDRVAVMYLGRLCELADAETIYRQPVHPYTRTLLDAVPEPDPDAPEREINLVPGELPSPVNPPSGCPFRTRCPRASEQCKAVMPELREITRGHIVACHHPLVPEAG